MLGLLVMFPKAFGAPFPFATKYYFPFYHQHPQQFFKIPIKSIIYGACDAGYRIPDDHQHHQQRKCR